MFTDYSLVKSRAAWLETSNFEGDFCCAALLGAVRVRRKVCSRSDQPYRGACRTAAAAAVFHDRPAIWGGGCIRPRPPQHGGRCVDIVDCIWAAVNHMAGLCAECTVQLAVQGEERFDFRGRGARVVGAVELRADEWVREVC